MSGHIKVAGNWVKVRVTPKDLELRKNSNKTRNKMGTNPLKMVHILCDAYNVSWMGNSRNTVSSTSFKYYYEIIIQDLEINVTGLGNSRKQAKRNAVFNLHHDYCRKIVY